MTSLRLRISLLLTSITALILFLLAGSVFLWVDQNLERKFDDRIRTHADQFHQFFLREWAETRGGIPGGLSERLAAFLDPPGIAGEVRRGDGTPVCGTEGFAPRAEGRDVVATVGGVPYRGRSRRVRTGTGETFELTLAVSEEIDVRLRAQMLYFFLTFLPLLLALTGLFGFYFAGRIFAPIEEMRKHAERISRQNLTERVPVPENPGELRELARTLNEMLDRLDGAFQDLQSFAADAAHELRTPLATLRAEIETALNEPAGRDGSPETLASLLEEVSRMSRIVTDLLTLARIDLRQYALQRERVSLRPLLEQAREAWQPSAEERGIRIHLDAADIELPADPTALRRVFMNLVENAIKYNREGGEVFLSAERDDGRVRVLVRDTGPGIATEHLPRLFHRFYRVRSGRSREEGGSGLGLAICKSFIEAHEGKIDVRSGTDGTTFVLDLPGGTPGPDGPTGPAGDTGW